MISIAPACTVLIVGCTLGCGPCSHATSALAARREVLLNAWTGRFLGRRVEGGKPARKEGEEEG